MADLSIDFVGIRSPNPFWLASAPPTDKEINVVRAFEAGWGGVVWKTVGEDPNVVNVHGPRYAVSYAADRRVTGFNNIELISDRPLRTNLDEMARVKRNWPDRAVVASIMVPCTEEAWKNILPMVEDTGCDGIELNFGCPHGMSERGMGAAVGQVPEYIQMVAEWCKHYSKLPVIVKLTPNVADIRPAARAAKKGGADAVSLINTINSIMGVDLDAMAMFPNTGGKGSHGGYCGPGAKPIALHMVAEIARDPQTARPAHLGHRRRLDLARRGRVHRAGQRLGAGVHRGHGLRLQDRAGPVRRPLQLHGPEGLRQSSSRCAAAPSAASPTGSS
jgi:dihydropyrimidine dehydrogenase (NAD+) subunit PreA